MTGIARGVEVRSADVTDCNELIPALEGTDYLVSCVPLTATESQYPLIWAAKEAGVERFVPSEFGAIYEWEQSLPTDTVHRAIARQKVFIRRDHRTCGSGLHDHSRRLLARVLPGSNRWL